MSQHRYPCTAEPPPPILGGEGNHRHACIHDAAPSGCDILVEHECDCGMTWTAYAWTPRPAPDLSWITLEPPPKRAKLCNGIAIGFPALFIAALIFAWAVTR